jgi:hypothetical protein
VISRGLDGRQELVFADRSGSGWGEEELEAYRFEKQPWNFLPQDFLWQDILPKPGTDPITDIVSTLYDVFRPGAESESSIHVIKASTFYRLPRELIGHPGTRYQEHSTDKVYGRGILYSIFAFGSYLASRKSYSEGFGFSAAIYWINTTPY